jgi:hypothetical protein
VGPSPLPTFSTIRQWDVVSASVCTSNFLNGDAFAWHSGGTIKNVQVQVAVSAGIKQQHLRRVCSQRKEHPLAETRYALYALVPGCSPPR